MYVCSLSVPKEENKPSAANQASYGTKPKTLVLPFVTGQGGLSLHVASLPGRKARPLDFRTVSFLKVKFKTSARRGFH